MRKMKTNPQDKAFDIILYIILTIINVIMLYPFIYVLSTSLSDPTLVLSGAIKFLPKGINGNAYKHILDFPYFLKSYSNTIIYAALGTTVTLFLTSLTAYPLSLKKFRSKNIISFIYVFTMFFGGGMIPTYLVIKNLHMIDTIWALVLPGALSAFNIIIFRSFFSGISESLHESAYIDGANDWTILFKIILPLSKPILSTIALFTIVGHWNNFFGALLYINDREKYPLQMILRSLLIDTDLLNKDNAMKENSVAFATQTIKSAAIIVTILPIVCVYPFIQKYFVKGIMIGSIKG